MFAGTKHVRISIKRFPAIMVFLQLLFVGLIFVCFVLLVFNAALISNSITLYTCINLACITPKLF